MVGSGGAELVSWGAAEEEGAIAFLRFAGFWILEWRRVRGLRRRLAGIMIDDL